MPQSVVIRHHHRHRVVPGLSNAPLTLHKRRALLTEKSSESIGSCAVSRSPETQLRVKRILATGF
jgi:hypothetical protein